MKTFLLTFAITAAVLAPDYALAEDPLFVDNSAACRIQGQNDADTLMMLAEAGYMTLASDGMRAFEYYCEFDRAIKFWWGAYNAQTTIGYCEEPGFLEPGVFTVTFSEDGFAEVHSSLWPDAPIEFTMCEY